MLTRRAMIGGALSLAFAGRADGHSWFDPYCCNGNDCQPVPVGAVKPIRGGWRVRLMPGEHPMISRPMEVTVPHTEAKPSEDGEFYACIFPADTLRCLYVPQGGA